MAQMLVTGSTGFIGSHLVPRLVERGDHVRCLVRGPQRPEQFAGLAVDYVQGDVAQNQPLDAIVAGSDVVYHLGGVNLAPRAAAYHQVNAEGTRRLAEACARQPRPPVFIYVSSLAAVGPAPLDQPLTEECPAHPVSAYGRSKLAAERFLHGLADRLPITILRPPAVFGPGDRYLLKLFGLVKRRLNVVPGRKVFRVSWIYVADLVEAMLLAAARGRRLGPAAGQGIYFVSLEEHPTVVEMGNLAAAVQGLTIQWTIHVPRFLCWLAAGIRGLRMRLTGRLSWLTPDKLREVLAGPWLCSPEKAKRELGFTCHTGLAEGFRLTCQWYLDHGWLRPVGVRGQGSGVREPKALR
jgi:nucleoside-diphosphate-sugar epimerase